MKSTIAKLLLASSCAAACISSHANLIVNGSFESGLSGWTTVDQFGSEGTFYVQSGNTAPISGSPVPVPPDGSNAAMSDAFGPGAHVLYQDFTPVAAQAGVFFWRSTFLWGISPVIFTFTTHWISQHPR